VTISDDLVEGQGKPHRRPSPIHPFVGGRPCQARVQRWLLPFEQE
jgi:hypothetical protein